MTVSRRVQAAAGMDRPCTGRQVQATVARLGAFRKRAASGLMPSVAYGTARVVRSRRIFLPAKELLRKRSLCRPGRHIDRAKSSPIRRLQWTLGLHAAGGKDNPQRRPVRRWL